MCEIKRRSVNFPVLSILGVFKLYVHRDTAGYFVFSGKTYNTQDLSNIAETTTLNRSGFWPRSVMKTTETLSAL